MKKAFLIILGFYFGFHFIIPKLYFIFVNEVYIYSDLIDKAAANKAFFLNFFSILLTAVLIYTLPIKEAVIPPSINSRAASELYYFAIFYMVIFLVASGGFQGIISGSTSGSILNYINLFLNPAKLLLIALFLQNRKVWPLLIVLSFIVITTAAGSRSAIITILIMALTGVAFRNFYLYKKKLSQFLKVALLLSPVLFVLATRIRYGGSELDVKLISNLIIGRVSFIELGMIPIHYFDQGGLDLSSFYEKYSFLHQLKLIIDSLIPGQIFGFDVMPNNYFRSIFFGYSEDFVFENYMSMNITLPVYFYMLYGYFGIIMTVIFLLSYFVLIYKLKKSPLIVIILLSLLYEVLIYFDWVMIWNQLFVGLLTVFTLKVYILFRRSFKNSLRKNNVKGLEKS